MQKLKTIEVKGKKFPVSINEDGRFFAAIDDEQVSAESLKELTDKLASRIARRKRVNIPFCWWDDSNWRDDGQVRTGVIIGIHGSNDNLLVKFDGETKSEQMSSHRLTDPTKAKELKELGDAQKRANKAFRDFLKKYEFDGRAKVREALGETEGEE